jgi:hypothetical protein
MDAVPAVSAAAVPGASAAAITGASSDAAPEEGGAPARVPQAASAAQQKTAIHIIFTIFTRKPFYKKNRPPVHIKALPILTVSPSFSAAR